MHALLCDYGGWLGVKALYGIAIKQKLFEAKFRNPVTKEVIEAGYLIVFKYLFYTETMFIFITLLCWVMGLTLTFFVTYHLTMVR
jgi:palmitoyltransferase